MIGKVITGKSFGGCIRYVVQKHDAVILDAAGIRIQEASQMINDFNLQTPVYVGDTMGDYTSATKAGVPFIFANYGFGLVEEGMVATISTFGELTELL